MSVSATAALKEPAAAGVKVTVMVQLPPAATLEPQLLVWAKSPGFAPATARLEMLNAALPELLSETL